MQSLLLEIHQIWTQLYELTVADIDNLTKAKKMKKSKPPKLDVFPVIKLDIPTHDSVVFKLVRIGTPRAIAQELVEIYTKLVSELASQHERIYHEECLSVLNACNSSDDDNDDFVGRSKIYSHLQNASRRLFIQRTQTWEKDLLEICRTHYTAQGVPSDIPQKQNSCFKVVRSLCFRYASSTYSYNTLLGLYPNLRESVQTKSLSVSSSQKGAS